MNLNERFVYIFGDFVNFDPTIQIKYDKIKSSPDFGFYKSLESVDYYNVVHTLLVWLVQPLDKSKY